MADYYSASKNIFIDRQNNPGTIICGNLTTTNLVATNATLTNITTTNITIANIGISNLTVNNLTVTSDFVGNTMFANSLEFGELYSNNGAFTFEGASVGYITTCTIPYLTSVESTITTASITNITSTNSTITNITCTTSTLTNITNTSITSTNTTTTNLRSTSSTLTNVTCTTMTFTNATGSSLVLTNTLGALLVNGPAYFQEDVDFYDIDVLTGRFDTIIVDLATSTSDIQSTIESTSVSTGCLKLSGGLGVAKTINCNKFNIVTQARGTAIGTSSQTTAANANTDLTNAIWSSVTTVNMTWTATSGKFTITEAGYYFINVNVIIGSGPTAYIGLNLFINGTAESSEISEMYYYAGNCSINRFKYLAVNDTVNLGVYPAFGNASFGGSVQNHFIVYKLY